MNFLEGLNNSRLLGSPLIEKRLFYSSAQYFVADEHLYDISVNKNLLDSLKNARVDLFSFIERRFLNPKVEKREKFFSTKEGIGLMLIGSYEEWLKSISSRRRFIKKGQKLGLETRVIDVDEEFLKSALRIYNETPVRQGRRYTGYGLSINDLRAKFENMGDSEVIGAYYKEELVGLIWVDFGDRVAAMKSFLSLISHRDKCPNNCLIAQAVKRCSEKGYRFLTYGNMGYNPSLDFFKQTNGFRIYTVPRYFIPLSMNGQLAIKLKVYQSLERTFSPALIRGLIPFYNLYSRYLATHYLSSAAA